MWADGGNLGTTFVTVLEPAERVDSRMHPRAAAISARVERAQDALRPSVPRPEPILRQDGTPDPSLLRWADQLGLPIAWLLEGDERLLLIAPSSMANGVSRSAGSSFTAVMSVCGSPERIQSSGSPVSAR